MSAILPPHWRPNRGGSPLAARRLGLGPVIVADFLRERVRPVVSLLFPLDRGGFQFGYGYPAGAAALVRRMAAGTGCPTHCAAPTPRHHDRPPARLTYPAARADIRITAIDSHTVGAQEVSLQAHLVLTNDTPDRIVDLRAQTYLGIALNTKLYAIQVDAMKIAD